MAVSKIEFLARALCEINGYDPEEFSFGTVNWSKYEKRAELLAKLLAKSDKVWNERGRKRVSKKAREEG